MNIIYKTIVFLLLSVNCFSFDFGSAGNRLKWSDQRGCLNFWLTTKKRLKLDEELNIPIRFGFNSRQVSYGKSCLGYGWWVPLLESNLMKVSESSILMNDPGGEHVTMSKIESKPNAYASKNGFWNAAVDGDVVTVTGNDGWILVFNDGLLSKLKTPRGHQLEWNRDAKGRVKSIHSTKLGLNIAEVKYSGDLMENLRFRSSLLTPDIEYNFKAGKAPVLGGGEGAPLQVANLVPAISAIASCCGELWNIDYTARPDLSEVGLEMQEKGGFESKVEKHTFTWDALSGSIRSDKNATYSVAFRSAADSFPEIKRTSPDGKSSSYYFDSKKLPPR